MWIGHAGAYAYVAGENMEGECPLPFPAKSSVSPMLRTVRCTAPAPDDAMCAHCLPFPAERACEHISLYVGWGHGSVKKVLPV